LQAIVATAPVRFPRRADGTTDREIVGENAGAGNYLSLLKRALTGAAHQEAYKVIPDPAPLIGQINADNLEKADMVLALRLDDEARRDVVEEGKDWPLIAETMIGLKRLNQLERALTTILQNRVPGDLIEAGVWRGGATIFMRGFLAAHGVTDRRVWLADSFEGVPPPDPEKYPADADDPHHSYSLLAVDETTVRANFRRYRLSDDQLVFLKGRFRDTLPTVKDRTWSLVRLDGDLYESTMDGLVNLYPGLSVGGFLIVDDYGAIDAAAKAVDDFREAHGITEHIERIDWTGIYWQKARPLAESGSTGAAE